MDFSGDWAARQVTDQTFAAARVGRQVPYSPATDALLRMAIPAGEN